MDFSQKRDRILEINTQLAELEGEKERLTKELQLECSHSSVVERDSHPPRRICITCSHEEEGWGCGYKKLRESTVVRVIPDSESHIFWGYRQLKPLVAVNLPAGVFH